MCYNWTVFHPSPHSPINNARTRIIARIAVTFCLATPSFEGNGVGIGSQVDFDARFVRSLTVRLMTSTKAILAGRTFTRVRVEKAHVVPSTFFCAFPKRPVGGYVNLNHVLVLAYFPLARDLNPFVHPRTRSKLWIVVIQQCGRAVGNFPQSVLSIPVLSRVVRRNRG